MMFIIITMAALHSTLSPTESMQNQENENKSFASPIKSKSPNDSSSNVIENLTAVSLVEWMDQW